MSVMLGMVVATFGLVDDPFERGEHARRAGQACRRVGSPGLTLRESAGHDLHGDDAHAGFGGGIHGLVHGGIHGEVVGRENHVENFLLDHPGDELRLAAVGADADEADLALLLGELLRFDVIVVNVGGLAAGRADTRCRCNPC